MQSPEEAGGGAVAPHLAHGWGGGGDQRKRG